MSDVQKLKSLISDQQAIYANIQWNLGGLIGMAAIIEYPKLINLADAPLRIDIEGLDVDGLQCLGVALLEKDRQPRANELLAMAKRSLVCESLELAADFLVRSARVHSGGNDPYEEDNYFSIDIRELWNVKPGKAGSLITSQDRSFFENCAAPLRNLIRHNNGRLLPKKRIVYSGHPSYKPIDVNIEWVPNQDTNIKLSLSLAHDIFITIAGIVESGLNKALQDAKLGHERGRIVG